MGDKTECFGCGTHFSKTPPLERLVDWAYQQKLKDKTKTPQDGKGGAQSNGKGKGKGKGKEAGTVPKSAPAPTATNKDDTAKLAEGRKELLAALQQAAESTEHSGKPGGSGAAAPSRAPVTGPSATGSKGSGPKKGSELNPGAFESAVLTI